ncbi:MAG: hypothetical protein ACREPB_08810 [Arenimonas sp.]
MATEGYFGLFRRTKFNGKLLGNGGNDPGIQTEMLTDPKGEVGVILFSNTSLSGPDQRVSGAIFDTLWKHATSLKDKNKQTGSH